MLSPSMVHDDQHLNPVVSSVTSLGVAEGSILLILIFLRRRVKVAIALLREASK